MFEKLLRKRLLPPRLILFFFTTLGLATLSGVVVDVLLATGAVDLEEFLASTERLPTGPLELTGGSKEESGHVLAPSQLGLADLTETQGSGLKNNNLMAFLDNLSCYSLVY